MTAPGVNTVPFGLKVSSLALPFAGALFSKLPLITRFPAKAADPPTSPVRARAAINANFPRLMTLLPSQKHSIHSGRVGVRINMSPTELRHARITWLDVRRVPANPVNRQEFGAVSTSDLPQESDPEHSMPNRSVWPEELCFTVSLMCPGRHSHRQLLTCDNGKNQGK